MPWTRISELEVFICKMGIIILLLPKVVERFKGAVYVKAFLTYKEFQHKAV